uniref:Uncharacterized protein n=1 Tax=Rhizoctonia solani TaxID=456999 RepID=N0ABY9_9AGAM|nr:hypothetical protein RSOL_m01410 [Rhizoctonia solani]AGK45451.1 hypothetical protein RSOL_m01410 [Rhizoctonia solani]
MIWFYRSSQIYTSARSNRTPYDLIESEAEFFVELFFVTLPVTRETSNWNEWLPPAPNILSDVGRLRAVFDSDY